MTAPIRVMHVVDSLGKGGLENGVVNLIERLDPDRFAHTVLAIRRLGPNADRLPADRVRVTCLEKKDTDSPLQIGRLMRAIRSASPDIVHSRNWAAAEAVIAGRLVRSVAVVHSEHGLEADASATEPLRRRWFRRIAFELSDRVLSVSYQLRDLHAARTGFPARKITVIHNGVDSRLYSPDREARARVRAELGIWEGRVCIGCVGNLLPVKDHLTLLKALEALGAAGPDWCAVLIGAGPELSRLQEFLDARPALKQRVSFLGLRNQVRDLLNAMDVYILPSIAEGISNSLLEAMATGLSVAATATGGNPEVVVDGESGLLFPVGNVDRLTELLASLCAQEDLRAQLGRQALRRAREEFSMEAMVRNYDQVYTDVAVGKRAKPRQLSANVST